MTTTIPFVDLAAQMSEIRQDVEVGLREVLAKTAFVGGPAVAAFEKNYARAVGVAHCVGVANGTDALELALRATGVGVGDDVILPANTFIATAEAVSRAGARPVLVDVDPAHLLIDPNDVAAKVTSRTRAIIPVHLFGQMAPVEEILPIAQSAGAVVIEDAAQAQGAQRHGQVAGSLGLVAATSFYPGKNLGAAGDAGAVTTNDDEIARIVRMLGAHGSERKYEHEIIGMNSRLDAVQAVVLDAKLARLEAWNSQRRTAASHYDDLLASLPGVTRPATLDGNTHVWHLYVIQVERRDRILTELQAAGVGAGIHYPYPLHLTPAYEHLGVPHGAMPVSEAAADRILSLPMHPHLTAQQRERVAQVLADSVT